MKSVYFSNKVKSEQLTYEDLIIESISIYGTELYYLPKDVVVKDNILNEEVESKYDDAYLTVAYIENTEGFEGEGELFSKFGLEIRDEATFIFAKRTWDNTVQRWETTQSRPNEGDLIYLPMSKSLFEITFVEREAPFYQLNNLTMYKVSAQLFELSEADSFDTDIPEIDAIEHKSAYSINLTIDSSSIVGGFLLSERVEHTNAAGALVSGEVSSYVNNNNGTHTVNLIDLRTDTDTNTDFTPGNNITGTLSGASATVTVYNEEVTDDGSQNEAFQVEASQILDFSEDNPFGETL